MWLFGGGVRLNRRRLEATNDSYGTRSSRSFCLNSPHHRLLQNFGRNSALQEEARGYARRPRNNESRSQRATVARTARSREQGYVWPYS
jgi:hypothetical protein